MLLDSPHVRAPGHDEEASEVFARLLEATDDSQVRIGRRCKLLVREALMLKSPPMKSTWCCSMWAWSRRKREVAASRFLATLLLIWTEQNVTVGDSAAEGRRSKPRTTRATRPNVSLLEEDSVMGKTAAQGLKRVFVEQDGKVVAVSVGVELVRDMWCVIAGFLKDHNVEAAAGCGKALCGSPACWASVPLEHREAVRDVHEVTDRVGDGNVKGRLGSTKTSQGKHNRRRLGKGFVPCAVSLSTP